MGFTKPAPIPGETHTVAAGVGFHGYGCGLPWKTPGLPIAFPKDDEATATDDEAAIPEKASKRRKVHTNRLKACTFHSLHLSHFLRSSCVMYVK